MIRVFAWVHTQRVMVLACVREGQIASLSPYALQKQKQRQRRLPFKCFLNVWQVSPKAHAEINSQSLGQKIWVQNKTLCPHLKSTNSKTAPTPVFPLDIYRSGHLGTHFPLKTGCLNGTIRVGFMVGADVGDKGMLRLLLDIHNRFLILTCAYCGRQPLHLLPKPQLLSYARRSTIYPCVLISQSVGWSVIISN